MFDLSLLELVLVTSGVLLSMAVCSCLCCLFMKYSDIRMRNYIIETAKKNGVQLDMDKLDPKNRRQSPLANENCTIMIPDVGIIL